MPRGRHSRQPQKRAAPDSVCPDTHSMIENAKSLQRVAKELESTRTDSPQSDPLLFNGTTLATAILLPLATELALKALVCLERKQAPPRTHNLLKLFEQLELETQESLRTRMPGWPEIIEVAPFEYGSLPEILWSHSDAHTHWRFIHEKRWGVFRSGELSQALTLITDVYDKRWRREIEGL